MYWYQKMLSYLYPVNIKKVSNERHQNLMLQLYCNQLMLSTKDAVYSFGTFYSPFRKSFLHIKKDIPNLKSLLMLGTGLGSALKILQKKYNCYPTALLVDNDKDIIELSRDYMELNSHRNVEWLYTDALYFMEKNENTYDLICVDVFRDTMLPKDFKQTAFFILCKKALNKNGYCIFNMILNSTNENSIISERLQTTFTQVKEIHFKVNTFFICR